MMKAPQQNNAKKIAIMLGIVTLLFLYFAGVFKTAFSPFGVSWNPITVIRCCAIYGYPWKGALFCVVIIIVVGAVLITKDRFDNGGLDVLGRAFRMSLGRQTYGDSHFEKPEEFKDFALVQSPKEAIGTIFGQMDATGKKLINQRMSNTRNNRHILAVGKTGCGKTFSFVKPYCFQCVRRRESIVITDPDGGLYRDLAQYFRDSGYVVRALNCNNLKKSDGWDCIKTIQGENAELLAQLFSNIVISNLVDKPDSIYGTGPMALLKACVLRVVLGHDFPDEEKNIGSVYQLLQNPAGEEFLDTMFDPVRLQEDEMPCVYPYLSYKTGSPNLRGNIITNLSVQLQLLQNKLLCQVLSTDDIDLTLPGQQPCAFFCIFPDSHNTYKFVSSLFFSMLFIQLTSYADNETPDGRLPIPVNFMLDEFPSIGTIPDFDRKMATVRKRAMNVCMIVQNIGQLENNYEDAWDTIMSNCGAFVSLGINDEKTAKWVTDRIGETTVSVQTIQHEAGESMMSLLHRKSMGEGKRALLSYDEIYRMSVDDTLIIPNGHNPIYAQKYPYTLHPDAKKLRPVVISKLPDITDIPARRKMREEEHRYVEAYLAKHPLSEVNRDYAKMDEPTIPTSTGEKVKRRLAEAIKKAFNLQRAGTIAVTNEDDGEWDEEFTFLSLGEDAIDDMETQLKASTTGAAVSELFETLRGTNAPVGEQQAAPVQQTAPVAPVQEDEPFERDFGVHPSLHTASQQQAAKPPIQRPRPKKSTEELWGIAESAPQDPPKPQPRPHQQEQPQHSAKQAVPTPAPAPVPPSSMPNVVFYKPQKKKKGTPTDDFDKKMQGQGPEQPGRTTSDYIQPPPKKRP